MTKSSLLCVFAGAICVALLVAEKTRLNAGLGLAVIASGLPVYAWWRGRAPRVAADGVDERVSQ